jgi:hypothetical protein
MSGAHVKIVVMLFEVQSFIVGGVSSIHVRLITVAIRVTIDIIARDTIDIVHSFDP